MPKEILYAIDAPNSNPPKLRANFGMHVRSLLVEPNEDGALEVDVFESFGGAKTWLFDPKTAAVEVDEEGEALRIEDSEKLLLLDVVDDELWLSVFDEKDSICPDEDVFLGRAMWREVSYEFEAFAERFKEANHARSN